MIRTLLAPRHSFMSVATEIRRGLDDGTVYLNDKALIDAGYTIHEYAFRSYIRVAVMFPVYFSVIMGVAFLFFVPTKHDFEILVSIILTPAILILAFNYTYYGGKTRVITKNSDRSR